MTTITIMVIIMMVLNDDGYDDDDRKSKCLSDPCSPYLYDFFTVIFLPLSTTTNI